MIRSFFLICLLSLNLSAENNEKALNETLLNFWEARNSIGVKFTSFSAIEWEHFPINIYWILL